MVRAPKIPFRPRTLFLIPFLGIQTNQRFYTRGVRHGPCPNEEVPRASSFFDAMCWKGSKKRWSGTEIGLPGGAFSCFFFVSVFYVFGVRVYRILQFPWFRGVPGTQHSSSFSVIYKGELEKRGVLKTLPKIRNKWKNKK